MTAVAQDLALVENNRIFGGGGTQISGNTIYGGQIVGDKTLGRSYDFESEDYQKYLDATQARSMQNPLW